jgi:glycosyltransferase involved in cell wall biosynthesis
MSDGGRATTPTGHKISMISVIIPTARRPQLLLRAVDSVMAQSSSDLELVVVVDGPDPETTQLLSDIDDPRLRVIVNPKSLGGAGARNVGIKAARGEWVAFLDDDDEWLRNKLERQLAVALPISRPAIISCLSYVVTPLQRYIWPRRVYDNLIPLAEYLFDRRSWFRGDVMLQCSSLFMSRELSLELMFAPEHDDWDLLLRAVNRKNARIVTVNEPLVIHHTEDGRASLGASFDWKESLVWVNNNRDLISPRAYAGFCLTIVAPQAAKVSDYSAFFVLLYSALIYGSPRLIHFALYLGIWLIPMRRRQKLRSLWYRVQNRRRRQ